MLAVLDQRHYLEHHLIFEQALLLRQDALAEQLLQFGQLTAFEQRLVATDLRHQRLLGRKRQDVGRIDAQLLRGGLADLLDGVVHECLAGDIVPEHVDLVQHGKQAVLRVFVELADVLLPDLHVASGDASVGRQHEQHRLGVGQHGQGQFRLAAEGIEPGRVDHAQALAQQGVVEVDQGMPPGGHQYIVAAADALQRGGIEAKGDRLFHRHGLGLRDLGEGLGHALRVTWVQRQVQPQSRGALELGDAGVFQARLDGQQANIGSFRTRVEEQLGGAHGGATGAGRQDALAIAGEEQAVDQLGLAAGVFADERQGDVIGAQHP